MFVKMIYTQLCLQIQLTTFTRELFLKLFDIFEPELACASLNAPNS